MKFTFGIITTVGTCHFIQQIVDTICEENIPEFEIIVVGGGGSEIYRDEQLTMIPFDESQKSMWITRKKNIITENAKHDNIVYLHDYVNLVPGWYEGFKKFGDNFDICMTPILNLDGTRFRDWTLWYDDPSTERRRLLPYDVTDLSRYMYISGAYWIAKRTVMQKYPLDESLSWGESEDVRFSKAIRKNHTFSININSSVKLLKQKDPVFTMASQDQIELLRKLS